MWTGSTWIPGNPNRYEEKIIREDDSRESGKIVKNYGKGMLAWAFVSFQAREPRVLVSSRQFWNSLFFKVLIFPLSSFSSIRIKTFFSRTRSPFTSQGQCLHWVSIMVVFGGKVYWTMICLVLTILWANPSLFFIKLKKNIYRLVQKVCPGRVSRCMFFGESDTY